MKYPTKPLGALILIALGGVLVPQCSGDGEPGSGGSGVSGPPIAFADYCSRFATLACTTAHRCDCLPGGASVSMCERFVVDDCEGDVDEPVNAGRMTFDAVAAGNCIASLEAIIQDCSVGDDANWPTACDSMLVAAVPEDGTCDDSEECVGNLDCRDDRCTRMPAQGETCADGSCADDLYCRDNDRCSPYAGLGAPCAESDVRCGDDLHCSAASETCAPYPTLGQSCADTHCDDDLYCDEGAVCRAELPDGAACDNHRQCSSSDCVENLCKSDDDDGGDDNDRCDFM